MSEQKKLPGTPGPDTAKERNKLGPVQPPPVFGTKKAPPAAPHKIARQLIESRKLPAKVFDPKNRKPSANVKSIVGGYASNTVGSPASIAELARALKNDVDLIFEHVYNNIEFEATFGSQRGPVGTLLDGHGNAFDQAELMVALCREAGYTADLVFGELRLDYGPVHDWLGTDPANLLPAYWLLSNAGIPADLTYIYPDYVIDVTHVWVRVEIDSTDYFFDPALKVYEEIAGIDLADAMDYDDSGFMTDATDGATQTANYIEDINRTNIRANLDTMTANLVDYIKTNAHGASVDEIVGGRRIVPQSGQVRDTEHPYLKPATEPDIWSDIPNGYKCTLRVQYDTIDETFYSQDIYGKRFTVFFNGSHEAELRLDGDLIATSDAQGTNTWNSMLLTVEHPYSWGWADQYAYHRIWADKYYLIANGWGNAGRGAIEEHRRRLDQAIFDGGADTDEDVLGETLAVQWHTLNALGCRNGSMIDRMTNCRTGLHHQIGVLGYFDTPSFDISMVVRTCSNLDTNWDGPNVAATAASMHGISNEAAAMQETTGVGGVSTTSIVDIAANAGQKIYYADSGNWTSSVEPNLVNYDSGTKTDIENIWINGGYVVVLPEDGEVTMDSWEGFAYYVIPPYPYSGAIGIIGGGLKGGGASEAVSVAALNISVARAAPSLMVGGYGLTSPKKKSKDPIGLFSGEFISSRTDLTVSSAPVPYGLALSRHYSSNQRLKNGPMGLGWKHCYEVGVQENSDGFLTLGEATPVAAAAGIVEMYVSVDLMSDLSKPLEKVLTVALANDWLIDQMTNNTAILSGPIETDVFVKLPDNSYVSSRGNSSVLEKSGTFSLQTAQGVRSNFNSDGQIETIEHPFGMTTTFTYTTGKLTEVDTGLGRNLEFAYTGTKLTSVTDGVRTVEFNFTDDDLTSVTDPLSNEIVYEYDEPGRLIKIYLPEHPADEVVTNIYDDLGRVKEQKDAYNHTWLYYFAGARSEEVDPLGNRKIFYYDQQGNPLRVIDALGNEVKQEFDGVNRLTKVTFPEGNGFERHFDNLNNLLEVRTFAKPGSGLADLVRTFTYDPTWNKVDSVEDELGNIITTEYDSETGQQLSITFPEVDSETPILTYSYNEFGQLETKTDATGIVTKFEYSETNEQLESLVHDFGVGRLNLTTIFDYDTAGNVISVTDPRGNEVTSSWNDNRLLVLITPPYPFSDLTTEFDYDANNNRTGVRRATGDVMNPWQTYSTVFDKENKVESISDPMSHVTSFGYDELRRRESTEDPEERSSSLTHDELSRVQSVEDAATNTILTKSYTNNGLLQSLVDARNKETLYVWDGRDRIESITYADSTTEEFEWDDMGNLLTFTTRNGDQVTFEYDALHRLRVKSPDNQPVVSLEYDLAGRLTSASTPVVSNHPESGEYEFFYDTAGRFVKEEAPDGKSVQFDVDGNGNVTRITYPDGYYVDREFDELNRLVSITLNGAMSPAIEFDYDEFSRRRQITAANGVVTDISFRQDNNVESIEHSFNASSVLFEYSYNALERNHNVRYCI